MYPGRPASAGKRSTAGVRLCSLRHTKASTRAMNTLQNQLSSLGCRRSLLPRSWIVQKTYAPYAREEEQAEERERLKAARSETRR